MRKTFITLFSLTFFSLTSCLAAFSLLEDNPIGFHEDFVEGAPNQDPLIGLNHAFDMDILGQDIQQPRQAPILPEGDPPDPFPDYYLHGSRTQGEDIDWHFELLGPGNHSGTAFVARLNRFYEHITGLTPAELEIEHRGLQDLKETNYESFRMFPWLAFQNPFIDEHHICLRKIAMLEAFLALRPDAVPSQRNFFDDGPDLGEEDSNSGYPLLLKLRGPEIRKNGALHLVLRLSIQEQCKGSKYSRLDDRVEFNPYAF